VAKWRVTYEDGRQVHAYAPDAESAKLQANHHEVTRVVIAAKRGVPQGPNASRGVHVELVKN